MKIKLYYYNNEPNAGDYYGRWLMEKMGFEVEYTRDAELCVCGSILQHNFLNNAKMWSCGLHNSTDTRQNLKNIYAVRGKLSALTIGLKDIPTGDSGILISKFYSKKVDKKFKYGIISHYIDYDFFKGIKLPDNTTLINMGTNNIEHVINHLLECEFTLSSSLHGIIFSHSFGIPSFRIKHNELASKHAFKFLDYYSNWNIKYVEKEIHTVSDLNYKDFDLLYQHSNLFVPSEDEIKECQNRLLNCFPYKEYMK